jgi:transaldolase/glucose-6-phosphate isomerase
VALLESARAMSRACAPEVPPIMNPGVQLGLLLGIAARDAGRDKVTILAGPGIESLGSWLEQLLAESTGKQGKGLIPIDAEPLQDPSTYGQDRVFVYLHLDGRHDPAKAKLVDALEHAGHPVVHVMLPAPTDIGGEFFRWEIATAVAGAVIGINPFDQPDVEASKEKTRALTSAYESSGKLPEEAPIFRENGVALYTDEANAHALGRHNTLEAYLRAHLGRAGRGDYVALLAYLERNAAHHDALQAIRARILERTHCATALGFGPRFLHSTGQAYKGGPASGVFLQITTDAAADLPVPGHKYTFGVVKAAQARGDFDVLTERGRRALRVHMSEVEPGMAALAQAVNRALD